MQKSSLPEKTFLQLKIYIAGLIFLLVHFAASAQEIRDLNDKRPSLSATVTVSKYTVAQKRLLVVGTAQFINILAQNNLDKDSVIIMACRLTGMPFLLPYTEHFTGVPSRGEHLINSGRIAEAARILKKAQVASQIKLFLELGTWYLHQPGSRKNDIDSAGYYIQNASKLSAAKPYTQWVNECRFLLAELNFQKGEVKKSKEILEHLVTAGQQSNNLEIEARAYQRLGIISGSYTLKRAYYQKSLNLYQKLGLKEKEIELLGDISICDISVSPELMEKDFRQIISLMNLTGFKHVLYAENQLTVACGRQGKYVDAFVHANAAFENMKWSGISAVASIIYIRFGSLYESLGKNDEALLWYEKALNTRNAETHVFWYKSLFYVGTMLLNKSPQKCLNLIDTVTHQFPPETVWEKLQVFSIKGECYAKLKNTAAADENYMAFLRLADRFPGERYQGDLAYSYILIGEYYVSCSNGKKARLFLNKAIINSSNSIDDNVGRYSLLYKIDSLEGNYKSAFSSYVTYKFFNDSLIGLNQRKELEKLTMKYTSEKKDQNIKFLIRQEAMQKAELAQSKFTRNVILACTVLLLIILLLLFSQFRMKQRINVEMNKSNFVLKQLVSEKEWLIKEVHHRVKNNLHTIINLLQSQAAYLQDDALKAIETSQNRIYTMSLIHQKLYQSEDIQTIDMAVYIPELIQYLKDSFENSDKIDFRVKICQVNLDASIAIPVALIINEALTNSIKYAFPDSMPGFISVFLQEQGESLKLELADNGVGMKASQIKESPVSLGMQLIRGLSKEIHGEVDIKNKKGVKITLLFKKHPLEYANLF